MSRGGSLPPVSRVLHDLAIDSPPQTKKQQQQQQQQQQQYT
jgi:hypothetical protein